MAARAAQQIQLPHLDGEPDAFASAQDETRIRSMFDRISGRYDLMNTVMTAGLHHRWRGEVARLARLGPADRALDVCCGTGDLTLAVARQLGSGGGIVGVDFSEQMLVIAGRKAAASDQLAAVEFVTANALDLPFAADSFDATTVGFGARNLSDLEQGLTEMVRVTRPGGRVVCLEVTAPRAPLRWFFDAWFDHAVPLVGRVASDQEAYAYLPASAKRFPSAAELGVQMERAGLEQVAYRLRGGGIVAIHHGIVRGSR